MTSPVLWFAAILLTGIPQAPAPQNPPEKSPAKEAAAAQVKPPAKAEPKAPAKKLKRVFTNDDVERPGERPNPRESEDAEENADARPAKSKTKASGNSAAARPEETREYYTEKIAPLRNELHQVESELSSARYKPEYDPQTRRPIISHSKQNEVERLERRRGELQKRIAAVCEEAARNNVSVSGC